MYVTRAQLKNTNYPQISTYVGIRHRLNIEKKHPYNLAFCLCSKKSFHIIKFQK